MSVKFFQMTCVAAVALALSPLASAAEKKDGAAVGTVPKVSDDGHHAGPDTAGTLGDGPWQFNTLDYKIKVTKMAGGLQRPYSIAFLPDGGVLVTERVGRLVLFRNGGKDKKVISGVPEVLNRDFVGLMDVVLHPKFKENHYIYLTYAKPSLDGGGLCAVGRGKYEGGDALVKFEELYVGGPEIPSTQLQNGKVRLTFTPDGKMMFLSCSVPDDDRLQAQNPKSVFGKILRLRDDGAIPSDNPLIGKTDFGQPYKAEIYSVGHRSTLGMGIHPTTGQLWEVENGPAGGDELNLIVPGGNYGWPIVSQGIEYDGSRFPYVSKEGYVDPVTTWTPAIAPSGMTFYTGDKFPKWKNSIFVGGMIGARIDRINFTAKGVMVNLPGPYAREHLLEDLHQRVRDIRQGPDGFIYVVTDYAKDGALLRIEPAEAAAPAAK